MPSGNLFGGPRVGGKKNKEDWNDGARPLDNERFRVGPLESDARQAFLNGIRSCNGGIAH